MKSPCKCCPRWRSRWDSTRRLSFSRSITGSSDRTSHEEGKPWVYNSYVQWRDQFPFWSHDTIKRAIQHLEALGVLISTARFNRKPIDKTKWYTINYDRLNAVCGASTMQNAPTTMQNAPTLAQTAPMDDAKCTDGRCKMHPLPEITAETTLRDSSKIRGERTHARRTSGAREAKVKRLPRPAYPSGSPWHSGPAIPPSAVLRSPRASRYGVRQHWKSAPQNCVKRVNASRSPVGMPRSPTLSR